MTVKIFPVCGIPSVFLVTVFGPLFCGNNCELLATEVLCFLWFTEYSAGLYITTLPGMERKWGFLDRQSPSCKMSPQSGLDSRFYSSIALSVYWQRHIFAGFSAFRSMRSKLPIPPFKPDTSRGSNMTEIGCYVHINSAFVVPSALSSHTCYFTSSQWVGEGIYTS